MLSWLVSAVVDERHGGSMKNVHGSDVFTHSSSLLPAARQPLGVHVVCASYMAVGCVGNVAGSEIQGAWIPPVGTVQQPQPPWRTPRDVPCVLC
jgi:hypothetical protein